MTPKARFSEPTAGHRLGLHPQPFRRCPGPHRAPEDRRKVLFDLYPASTLFMSH